MAILRGRLHLLIDFINSYTMPAFMMLGGALFRRSMEKGKYPTIGMLARDKALRLLVPFLVVTLFYSFPLKLATGYFRESESVVKDLLLGQLLIQGNTYLWYLPTMFFDFLLCYLLERYVKISSLAKLAILGVLSVAVWADSAPLLLVAYPLRFLVWFYAGYCFESVRKKLRLGMVHGMIGMVATVVVYLILRKLVSTGGALGVVRLAGQKLLLPTIAVITLYSLSCGLANLGVEKTRLHRLLSRNTFGMYLYSDPVNYVVLYLGATLCGEFLFGSNMGVFVLYVLRIGLMLACSLLVSELLRRCKAKYIV